MEPKLHNVVIPNVEFRIYFWSIQYSYHEKVSWGGDGDSWNIQLTGDGLRFKISEYITIMQEVKGKDGAKGQKTENREGKCKFWLITYLISNEEET